MGLSSHRAREKILDIMYPIKSVVVFSVQFRHSVVIPWTAARQASLSITNSRSPPKPMAIELVMPFNCLILCRSLLLLPSIFPSIRVFSNESTLRIVLPDVWIPEREERRLPRQSNSQKGKFITDSSQGFLPQPTQWCRVRKSLEQRLLPKFIRYA